MKRSFDPTCDRHGHILTGVGVSPQVMAPFVFPTAEEMAFLPAAPNGCVSAPGRQVNRSMSKKRKVPFRIGKILVPVDSQNTKPDDLKRVIQLARQLSAQITLLHCYEPPRSLSYAKGDSGSDAVMRQRDLTLMRLQILCSKVRRSWPRCVCLFEVGSLPGSIIRVSKSMRADLIVMPVSLDSVSDDWSTTEVLDELARKAACPVLAETGRSNHGFSER